MALRDVATDRHLALTYSEQPETTEEIVGAQTYSARQEVAMGPPGALIYSEQPETMREIVGAQIYLARQEVVMVPPVQRICLEPLDVIDAGIGCDAN